MPQTDLRYKRLRTLLAEWREEKGLTQKELAAKLGRDQLWISRYEVGRRQLDAIELLDVCKAIGVDPCRLLRRLGG